MATFFENLRATNKLPTRGDIQKSNRLTGPTISLPTRGDIVKEHAQGTKVEKEFIDKQVKDTAPLRSEIRELSDGKVIVDESIYNPTELQRIKNIVQKMKDYNGGALFPGYTVISNSFDLGGPDAQGAFFHGDKLNMYGFASFPNGAYGTKNNPYRVYLKNANNPEYNDELEKDDIKSGWHPKTGEIDQSSAHTHELSHSVHKEALKKSHPPTLSMSPEEDEAYKNLVNKFSTFRDLVQKLTDAKYLENTKNAAKSVSGYAEASHGEDSTDKKFPFREMFAEAYTDVLYNGDSARPFSKALVKAYSDYLNEYNAIFGSKLDRIKRQFGNSSDTFVNNLRNSVPNFGNSRYIIE